VSSFNIWPALGFMGNPYDHEFLRGSDQGAALLSGRDHELRQVQVALASSGPHVSIEGDPGVGKTSLATVAGFDMLRQGREDVDGTLFLPASKALQLQKDPADFEREVWLNVARTMFDHAEDIRRLGHALPDLGSLEQWLGSPTIATGGSAAALGFSAGATRAVNTSSGFSGSGVGVLIRRELDRVFPSPGTGGVVCILDNLEILGTSEQARQALETIRGPLLEVPALRWVLVGSKGIITSARSSRLNGFIDAPVALAPLTVEQTVEVVQRRLDYWGTKGARVPVQPEDFRHLYKILGHNLRDSLSLAQRFARHYHAQFAAMSHWSDNERASYFTSWVVDQAESVLEDAGGTPAES
jgi:hypothetical protein